MKKRLICLFLCVVTLLSVALTSCGTKNDDEATDQIKDEASESAVTLSMWVVSEEKVSDATAAAVNAAVTAITKAKFKINLVLTYLTEDEYRAKLEQAIVAYEEARSKETTAETTDSDLEEGETTGEVVVTDETETNDLGMTVIKYPELLENQVDIIWIGGEDGKGEDMYIDFINKEWLAPLDNELASASKKIKEYVSSTLLSAAQYNGTTYAIPNNRPIGEYTYMMVDAELMKKYSQQGYIQANMIDGFYNDYLYSFLHAVHTFEDPTKVVPVDATYKECLDLLAHYWAIDPASYDMLDAFSVFGYHYTSMDDLSRGKTILGFDSLFENEDFVAGYLKLNQFRLEGYLGDAEADSKTAAVTFVPGDYSYLAEAASNKNGTCVYNGKEYYPIPVEYPTASTLDIYGNMFGVYSHSKHVDRSMKIVTYLNTNKDFRNLIQYGVENVNYKVEQDDNGKVSITRLNNDYMMDIFATGNVFIAYPDPELNMSEDVWVNGKVQNRYSLVAPLLGLNYAEYAATTTPDPESEKIGEMGFNLSYKTGYSKSVLCQDEKIKTWIDACDAAGKGVYVLETYEIKGQNKTALYYIYNNNVTNNVEFKVEVDRVLEESEPDSKGKVTMVQTNLDFILTYTDTTGTSATGYELSTMRIYTKKSNEYEVLSNVNATAGTPKITSQETLIDFDFLNTDEYSIEIYPALTKGTVYLNNELITWINKCDQDNSKTPTTYMMTYKSAEKDGKVETTYVLYRTGLVNFNTLDIQPTGDAGKLDLAFRYTQDMEYELDSKTEATYLLYYVRVTSNANVAVKESIFVDGEVENIYAKNREDRTEAKGDVDPNYEILGSLDTELVKFMATLNEKLIAKLNACTDYPSFEKVVKEMQLLLVTDEEKLPTVSQFTELADVVSGYVVKNSLSNFQYMLRCATSHEIVKHMIIDPSSPTYDLIEDMFKDVNGKKEAYFYYMTPYGIYYSWMSEYGYLPETRK